MDVWLVEHAKVDYPYVIEARQAITAFLRNYPHYNGNIVVPFTCNELTYIFVAEKGKVKVDSCHNHEWETKLQFLVERYEDEWLDYRDDTVLFYNIVTKHLETKKQSYRDRYETEKRMCKQ